MNRRSRLPLPKALKMPLRDILRGVTTVADLTEEVLEPATALLPGPVQATFRSALSSFDQAGARAVTPRIDMADIAGAKAYLEGGDQNSGALQTFIGILAFVWELAHSRHRDQQLLFSETVAAARLAIRGRSDERTVYARAASILICLRRANAASRFPGTPMTPDEGEGAYIDQVWLSAVVWLLTERASTIDEDIRLLELAFALCDALEEEIMTDMEDEGRLAESLQSLANHL